MINSIFGTIFTITFMTFTLIFGTGIKDTLQTKMAGLPTMSDLYTYEIDGETHELDLAMLDGEYLKK